MQKIDHIDKSFYELLEFHGLFLELVKKEILANSLLEIILTDDEIKNQIDVYCKNLNIKNTEEMVKHLKDIRMDKETLIFTLCIPLKICKYSLLHFKEKAHERFLERKEWLDEVIYSLVRVEDGFVAKELYLTLAGKEEEFGEIAKKYSCGHEKETLGVVGPVKLKSGHPELINTLKSSKTGELSPPFKIGKWWTIIRLESLKEAVLDEAMELKMSKELFEIWIEQQSLSYAENFKKKIYSQDNTKVKGSDQWG